MSTPLSKVPTPLVPSGSGTRRPHVHRLMLLAMSALVAAACASGRSGPANQEVAIRPMQDGKRVEASCEVGNGNAQWHVVAPTRMSVTRSSQELSIHCRTIDGFTGDLKVAAASRSYPDTLVVPITEAPGAYEQRIRQSPYASLSDVDRVPFVGEAGRQAYRRFLAEGKPRAFAVSDAGDWVRVNQTGDAERAALGRCQAQGARCRLYALDDSVVWKDSPVPVASN